MAEFHVYAGAHGTPAYPDVRRIEVGDLYDCLRAGFDDFMEKPSHLIFIVIMYPLIGVVLAAWTSGANALPMLFPLASGFALLGPFAAIGLYEISRRRELGMDTSWKRVLELRHSPALPSIAVVGFMLFAIFIAWLLVARALYIILFGPEPLDSLSGLLASVFGTAEGLDRARQCDRLPVRAGRAVDDGRGLPAADRPRRRRLLRHQHVGTGGHGQSRADADLGPDRRRAAGDRQHSGLRRPGCRHPDTRPRDLASLSQGGHLRPRFTGLAHDPEKWGTGFRIGSCAKKEAEHDDLPCLSAAMSARSAAIEAP